MQFEIGMGGDIHLKIPMKDIPNRVKVDLMRTLMKETGYAEALYKGADKDKDLQKHLDDAWFVVTKFREAK